MCVSRYHSWAAHGTPLNREIRPARWFSLTRYHNWPAFEYGSLHVKRGAVMAHPTSFKIVVRYGERWGGMGSYG